MWADQEVDTWGNKEFFCPQEGLITGFWRQKLSCNSFDSASQALCRAGARMDKQDTTCGRFFLTYRSLFDKYYLNLSKFLLFY